MIKNLAIGGRSNRALLLLALLLGVASAVLIGVYLSQAKSEGDGGFSGVVQPVVVASGDIPAGTRITAEMVTVKELPQGAVLAGVFQEPEAVVGQVARVPIVAGEQVVPSKVTASEVALAQFGENPPLALLVPEGMRAVSVEVSSLAGAGGLIRPGDFVDVILSVSMEVTDEEGDSIGRNQIAQTILQNVQVLAIDQGVAQTVIATEGEEGEGGQAPVGGGDINPEATTATLAVSPVHGEVLALADVCRQNFSGRLSLALRAFGDGTTVPARAVWPEDGPPPDCAALLGLTALQ